MAFKNHIISNSINFFDFGLEASIVGDLYAFEKDFTYNQNKGFWKSKIGRYYDFSYGGNGYTGGKYKYAQKTAKNLGRLSSSLGVYSVFATLSEYQNGEITGSQAIEDEIVNGVGFLGAPGAAANFGWNLGALLSKTEVYNRVMFGVHSQVYIERGIKNGYVKSVFED